MATVKILFVQDATRVEKYLRSNEREENPQTEQGVKLCALRDEFVAMQEKQRSRGNELIHLIQSFSPEESKRLTPEQVHAMGVKLVNRFAPGHQFVVQTHTDAPHLHNHIVLNPVSEQTGERIQNKKRHLQTARELSDAIALENGLSVLPGGINRRRMGLSDKVQRIDRMRGRSYIVDMANKANFARHHATSFDEYVAILNAFDVQVRIEPKNITYYYPDKKHGKRGRNLDPKLDRPALERKFDANRARVAAAPLVSARSDQVTQPREEELARIVIPIEELNRAKMQSILAYCERSKIALSRTEDGRTILKGRSYVEVSDYAWTNHRNKTRGNAIDFVAAHREVNFLHAVSILNDNPKLLLLEQHLGEAKKSYQSFYVPKGESAPRSEALVHLSRWLEIPASHRVYSELFKRQRVQVEHNGLIRLFSEKADEGVMEYVPQSGGRFQGRRRESARGTFFASHPRKAKELHLYVDPEAFLKHSPDLYVDPTQSPAALAVLLGPDLKAAHQAVARQRELARLIVIDDAARTNARAPDILHFFHSLRDSLDPFYIEVSLAWEPPTAQLPARAMSRDIGLEREIHFP